MTATRTGTLIGLETAPPCEHGWQTESRHVTSEGVVLYVRCVGCGARRIDLLPAGVSVPIDLSRAVRTRSGADR